jgi:hypothetical protein
MAILSSAAADVLTRRLPKVISGNSHLAIDYTLAGSLLAAGTWYWRQNRKAAVGALICSASSLGLTLLTTYPGRTSRFVSFPTHGKIETALAAMIATMPELLHFEEQREKRYFVVTAGILTVVSNLTQFRSRRGHIPAERSRKG